MDKHLKRLREKSMRLPLTPGVYIMKDKQGNIIYIGKAKALKNRVSQYFGSQEKHMLKVRKMVEGVEDFDYILTDNEFEALVLECSLIKQHRPKYNILLKDDKGYHYIKVTNGPWPKITAALQKYDDGATYIGPFTSSFSVSQSVNEALKIFKLPQCNKIFPRDIGKSRPCLNYFISQCSAPCASKISEVDYNEAVDSALEFLKGGSTAALKNMHSEMEEAAEKLEFERAARIRDRINAINRMNEKQKVVSTAVKVQDVMAISQGGGNACLMVLRFDDGRLYDSEHFIIDEIENLFIDRAELIRRYYSMRENIPPRLTLDGDVEDRELLEEWLSDKAKRRVRITVPQKGEQAKLVDFCRNNAAEKLAEHTGRTGRDTAALDELGRLLGLKNPPDYIEAYDISHTSGRDSVGGMVVFKNGVPLKSAYKRFAIRGDNGADDLANMVEVLTRRFSRYIEEKEEGKGFGKLPDVILLDGGHGQLNAILPVLKSFGLDIPTFGMVKDNRHRTRAIATNGGEIAINSKRQAFTLVSTIQNEVHRWAISYHKQKRSKSTISSTLIEIDGIGKSRATALLKHFKTIKAIKEASIEDLKEVKGIGTAHAEQIFKHFRKDN